MAFELPPLPYPKDALAPHIGAETLEFHYEKHHKGYMKKLKGLIENTPLAAKDLEEIIETSDGAIFNNAAQVWNHDFYWRSMTPRGGGDPPRDLRADLERGFGSLVAFENLSLNSPTEPKDDAIARPSSPPPAGDRQFQ